MALPDLTLTATPTALTLEMGTEGEVELESKLANSGGAASATMTFSSDSPQTATVTSFTPDRGFTAYRGGKYYPSSAIDEGRIAVACHQVGIARIDVDVEVKIVEVENGGTAMQKIPAHQSITVTCTAKTGLGCSVPGTEAVEVLGTALAGDPGAFCYGLDPDVSDEPTLHSSNEVPRAPGAGDHSETLARLAAQVTLDADQIASTPMLACGNHDGSQTYCVNPAQALVPGDYLLVGNVLHGAPPSVPQSYITYGLVFDGDGDPANDFQADPAYPNDWYQGTDTWYELEFDPACGWFATATKMTTGVPTALFGTAARVIVVDNAVTLLVPAGDFAAPAPAHRITAFDHPGDWGFGGIWSGDVEPPVAEGLAAFPPM
jgi:hypothetical protein